MKRVGILFATLLSTLLPVVAWASEGAEAGGKQSLPQMDVALYPGLIFWFLITFIPLYLVVRLVGMPGIKKTQSRRKKAVETDLTGARAANDEAQKVIAAYEAALAGAHAQAQKTVSDIIQAANDEATEQRGRLSEELSHRLKVADNNIEAARIEAMKEVPHLVNSLVQDIVTKVYEVGGPASGANR